MTECVNTARSHSLKNTNGNTSNTCVFVNEVLESEKMQIVKHKQLDNKTNSLNDSEPDHKFQKHTLFERGSASYDYKKDVQGRRYSDVVNDFQQGNASQFAQFFQLRSSDLEVFLADESLVVPRFLIVIS